MKRYLPALLCLALLAPASFASGGAEEAIRAANARMKEIILSGKADALMTDFYAPGAVLSPPDIPRVTTAANVIGLFNGLAALGKVTLDVTPDSIEEMGDTAIEIGTWTLLIETARAPQPIKDKGKYIVIWKHQKDGTWRASHDIWNSDNPPPPTPSK